MEFVEDGTYYYYIGNENNKGGIGKYQLNNGEIVYTVNRYYDDSMEQGELDVELVDGVIYLVKECEMNTDYHDIEQ